MGWCVTQIKVCGITRMDDARCAVRLGVDALGFNFYPKSPRYVTPEAARRMAAEFPPFLTTVGVFVDAALEEVDEVVAQSGMQVVQLHGDESPQYCTACRHRVLKAFRVGPGFDVDQLGEYAVSGFLLDTYRKGLAGGTGEPFDWSVARVAGRHGRIVLAGGLSPDNVEDAIKAAEPWAVDVNSGVEEAPGVKDPAKLEAFVARVRALDRREDTKARAR